jgi:hypothetical protein
MSRIVVTKEDFAGAFPDASPKDGYETKTLPSGTILFRGKKSRHETDIPPSIFMADFEHTKEYMQLTSGNFDPYAGDVRTFQDNPVRTRCNMFQAKRDLTLFVLNDANLKRLRDSFAEGTQQHKELTAYTGIGSTRPICAVERPERFPDKKEDEVVVCPTYLTEELDAATEYANKVVSEQSRVLPDTAPQSEKDELEQAKKKYRNDLLKAKLRQIASVYLAPRIGAIVKSKGFDGWVWMPDSLSSYWEVKPYMRSDLREILAWDWEGKFAKLDVPCYTLDEAGNMQTPLDVESVQSVLQGNRPIRQDKIAAAIDIEDAIGYSLSWVYSREPDQSDKQWIDSIRAKLPSVRALQSKPKKLTQIKQALSKYEALIPTGGKRKRNTTRRARKLKKTLRKIR